MRNVKIDLASFVLPSMAEKASLSLTSSEISKACVFSPGSFTLHQIPRDFVAGHLQPTGFAMQTSWCPAKFKGSTPKGD